MGLPLLSRPALKIGCGDPGDPIEFSGLIQLNDYLTFAPAGVSTQKAVINTWTKVWDAAKTFNTFLYSSPDLAAGSYFYFGISSVGIRVIEVVGGGTQFDVLTDAAFRDGAAPYNLHLEIDTTQASESDRIRLWVGGEERTLSGTFPSLNYNMARLGGSVPQYVSSWIGSSGTPSGGTGLYHANYAYGDDPATHSFDDFGRFNSDGHWVPKTPTSLVGLQYFLPFSDPLNMGLNLVGADLTEVGTVTQTTDTPTNNQATMDPNAPNSVNFSNGGRTVTQTAGAEGNGFGPALLVPYPRYFEAEHNGGNAWVGVSASPFNISTTVAVRDDGNIYNGSLTPTQTGLASWSPGDVLGFEVDPVAKTFQAYRNGVAYGAQEVWTFDEQPFVWVRDYEASTVLDVTFRFNPDEFTHTSPNGLLSFSVAELPCPDILNPEEYATTRVSTGGAGVNDLEFNPLTDGAMVISKDRTNTVDFRVTDTVRGAGKFWTPSNTVAEITAENGLSAFTATGYDIDPAAAAPWLGTREDLILRKSPVSGMDILEVNHTNGVASGPLSHDAGGVFDAAWLVPVSGGVIRAYYRGLSSGDYIQLNGAFVVQNDPGWLTGTANTVTVGASIPTDVYRLILLRSVPQFSFHGLYYGAPGGAVIPTDFSVGPIIVRPVNIADEWRYLNPVRSDGNPQIEQLRLNSSDPSSSSLEVLDALSNGAHFLNDSQGWSQNGQLYVVSTWGLTPAKFTNGR